MGNCCGGESKDNFQGEGRTLGAAPANAPPQTDGARAAAPPKISSPKGGQTLGRNPQAPEQSRGPAEAGKASGNAAQVRSSSATSFKSKRGNHDRTGRMVSTAWL